MGNRQGLTITLLVVVFAILGILIGVGAFYLGQQSNQPSEVAAERPALIINTPTPLATAPPPPAIVTNTPTRTPEPTATFGPTDTPTPTPTDTATPTDTPTHTPTPIVVITHVQGLGRLETTEYAMQTVIDLENDASNLWQQLVGSDKLMLVAVGEVVAGFDFEKIRGQDIAVNGTTVRIVLPAPEILYSRIDNEDTYVYERQTGLLVPPDNSLESRARQLAEEALVEWALEREIFDQAEKDGRLQIENLLRSLGFTDVTIEVREPEL